jgi:transposase
MDADQTSTDTPACPGCAQRDQRIEQLEKRIEQLEKRLEELSRSAKRQAAPFSRGLPKIDPKKPGRKSGEDYGIKAFRVIPPVIDEVHEAPLPARCPRCGGRVIESQVDHQYQVEIPRRPIYRQFNIHIGSCTCCDGRVQGRHPLQTSDALGCCASQIGPEAQSAVVMLNKELGLSQGKISRFFASVFGIKLTRGGSCQIMLRAADRCEGNYQAIVKRLRQSRWIVPDETGWRIGGHLAWLHTAVSEEAVAYLIARQRGIEASTLLIGDNYAGKMIHDGWASYDRFWRAIHQTCLGHLLRRCHELLETATRGAVVFPRRVRTLLQESLRIRDQRDARQITARVATRAADRLETQMEKLLKPIKRNGPNERFAKHLWKHRNQLFTFLRHRKIDATNYRAEQALRPAVVNRKVWGGNRTEAGAAAQSILMTVLFTARKQCRDATAFLSQVLRSRPQLRPLLLASSG